MNSFHQLLSWARDLPLLIWTHEPFTFSLPCPVEGGSDRAALVGIWCPPRVNPLQICIIIQFYILHNSIFYIVVLIIQRIFLFHTNSLIVYLLFVVVVCFVGFGFFGLVWFFKYFSLVAAWLFLPGNNRLWQD